jgi:glucan phosphoethanolaminetransferase (alkaline phosphatase superfamily)
MSTTYIPGVCNIGPAEIKLRKLSGIVGLSATIILFAVLLVGGLDGPWRLLIFFPALTGASGYLQAAFHFCYRFGMKGLFNMGNSLEHQDSVDQAEYRKKDQKKALLILSLSLAIAAAVTTIVYLLP